MICLFIHSLTIWESAATTFMVTDGLVSLWCLRKWFLLGSSIGLLVFWKGLRIIYQDLSIILAIYTIELFQDYIDSFVCSSGSRGRARLTIPGRSIKSTIHLASNASSGKISGSPAIGSLWMICLVSFICSARAVSDRRVGYILIVEVCRPKDRWHCILMSKLRPGCSHCHGSWEQICSTSLWIDWRASFLPLIPIYCI